MHRTQAINEQGNCYRNHRTDERIPGKRQRCEQQKGKDRQEAGYKPRQGRPRADRARHPAQEEQAQDHSRRDAGDAQGTSNNAAVRQERNRQERDAESS